jgi:hypothetical protein
MPIVRKLGASSADFEALIEKYKIQNPVKYQMKKVALEKKLADLKAAEGIEVEKKPKK